MFVSAKLNNFRQHREIEICFQPGINAIRGLNESGKTTILEAIAYALFGAKIALRGPIDTVVTYNEKVGTLKVEVEATFDGVTYIGRRSKSGAEIWHKGGTKPLVTGQDECTKHWEAVLGVSAKTAANLMLANQNALRGALSSGESAAVMLIEKLANFSLIDELIQLVVEKVPNGHTKQGVERIEALKLQLEVPLADETLPLLAVELLAVEELGKAERLRAAAQEACDDHSPKAAHANVLKHAAEAALRRAQEAHEDTQEAHKHYTSCVVPAKPDTSKLPMLRAQMDDATLLTQAKAAHRKLEALGECDQWEGDLKSLIREIDDVQSALDTNRDAVTQLKVAKAQAEGRLIKETQCAFCDKDLKDIPEVVSRNEGLLEQLAQIEASLASLAQVKAEHEAELEGLEGVLAANDARAPVFQAAARWIWTDNNFVPPNWGWTGPDVTKEAGNPAVQIKAIEDAQAAYDRAVGAKEQAERSWRLTADGCVLRQEAHAAAAAAYEVVMDDLTRSIELAVAYAQADAAWRQAQAAHTAALGRLETAQAVHRERVSAREALEASLVAEEEGLKKTAAGNALLGKLRTARPQIADKLWRAVLSSVSTTFSTIRGKASIVTRGDDGFEVDGEPISGLSGSTLDALGLAIRIALTKTFLPACRFLVLDEPAAAADSDREANMLGLLAAADFDQVLLVTHSEQSDAFAQNVIQL